MDKQVTGLVHRCALCGKESAVNARTAKVVIKRNGGIRSKYHPRLTLAEFSKLPDGLGVVCINRRACRARQAKR